MSSKRYLYTLKTDNGKATGTKLLYNYGKTKIELYLTKTEFYLTYERPKYDKSCLDDKYIKDALKKIELLYLVKYGKRAKYEKLILIIGEDSFVLCNKKKNETLVYSMINEKTKLEIAHEWGKDNKFLSSIANTTKSKYDRKFSSLFALLVAKTKDFEIEKFIYLWMAMNGLYGYLTNLCGKELKKEYKQIKLISKFLGFTYKTLAETSIKDKDSSDNKIRESTMSIIESISDNEYDAIIQKINNNSWEESHLKKIKDKLDEYEKIKEMDSFAFFHFWLPYQIRCKYFHGEKNIPLLSFKDERPIKCLRFLNKLLERFLDKELAKWFDKDKTEKEYRPKLIDAANNYGLK